MPKKKKREMEGSLVGSIVLGLVTALMGVLLGIFSLSMQSVAEVREMPKEVKPDTVYYVMGNDRGGDYKRKEVAFLEKVPGQIVLSEADLNRWAADTFKFSKPTGKDGESAGMIVMSPSAPSFRISDGVMQIGLSVEVDAFGKKNKLRYFAQGDFVRTADGFAFTPTRSYMGSAKLPPIGAASYVGSALLGVFKGTDRYQALNDAWTGLSSVSLDGSTLVLVR